MRLCDNGSQAFQRPRPATGLTWHWFAAGLCAAIDVVSSGGVASPKCAENVSAPHGTEFFSRQMRVCCIAKRGDALHVHTFACLAAGSVLLGVGGCVYGVFEVASGFPMCVLHCFSGGSFAFVFLSHLC